MREFTHKEWWRNYWKNRKKIMDEKIYPQDMTFDGGMKFLNENYSQDNWFLQIETFDPHEPFDVEDGYLNKYEEEYNRPFSTLPRTVQCRRMMRL